LPSTKHKLLQLNLDLCIRFHEQRKHLHVEGSTAAKRLKNTGLGAQSETEIYLASDYLKLI